MNHFQVYIKRIIALQDEQQMVFIERASSRLFAIPEYDDYMDFGDDNFEELLLKIESHPMAYLQITRQSSRELFNTMMDFAQEQENREHTSVLVAALRKKNGITHFKESVKKLDKELRPVWEQYYFEKRYNRIKHFLCQEKIKPISEQC